MTAVDALFFVAIVDRPRICVVQYVKAQAVEFKSRGGAIISVHFADDAHSGFAAEVANAIGAFFGQGLACKNHLHGGAAVAHFYKSDASAAASAFDPPFDGDGFTFVGVDLCYANRGA